MKKTFTTFYFKGFSLTEILTVLLILAIVVIASAPMITKKRNTPPERLAHGKWACKYINGVLSSVIVEDTDAQLPPDSAWKTGCDFPSIPKNTKYLWVEVYGGGGGGARGYATPWISKTYTYSLGTAAPRDGEYDLSAFVSNSGDTMSWLNATNSLNGIYYTNDAETKSVCKGNYFGEYKEEDSKYNYASCKSYSESDRCHYTGDSTAIKVTDCINASAATGKYCYRSTTERPPNAYITEAEMIQKCSSEGKKECKSGNNSITYTIKNKKCANQRYLPTAKGGFASSGVTGKLYLKKGEYVDLKLKKKGKFVPQGTISGYKHSSVNDGDDYMLTHMKSTVSNGIMHINEEKIADMKGGIAGRLSNSAVSSNCCTDCGQLDKYPNSSKTNSVFCAKNGDNGSTTLTSAYQYLTVSNNVSKNEYSIINQDFDYSKGCSGKNASYSASLYPTSKYPNYEFKVGAGGAGAKGGDDNTVTESAQDGEATYFGWIKAGGGKGASDYCKETTQQNQNTNKYNAGSGGSGGTVLFPNGLTPQRDYSLTTEEDTSPKNRWKVQDGTDGNSGLILVSW